MSTRMFGDDVLFLQRFLKSAQLYTAKLDGIYGPKTDAAVQAFETGSKEIAAALGTFDMRSEGRIFTLHFKTQELARKYLKGVRDAGIDARIISGTRTYAEQDALFRQGRFGNPGPKVTNARGGQSNHNFGIAWDIGIFRNGAYLGESPLYKKAAEIGLALGLDGLEWGGNWVGFPDQPHYQSATNLSVNEVREKFENGEQYI